MREKAKIKLAVGKSVQERAQDARAKLYMSLGILRKGIDLHPQPWKQTYQDTDITMTGSRSHQ